MSGTPCAVVYAWNDAPEELRALSEHRGDEDWVVVLDAYHGIWTAFGDVEPSAPGNRVWLPGWGFGQWEDLGETIVIIFAHA